MKLSLGQLEEQLPGGALKGSGESKAVDPDDEEINNEDDDHYSDDDLED